jgi:hypothetical protein
MHGPLNARFPFGLILFGEVSKSSISHYFSTVNSLFVCFQQHKLGVLEIVLTKNSLFIY